MIIKGFMNYGCSLKISEYVSQDIFYDMDELMRLKELNMNFDYAIDIEKPSNISHHHLVHYYLPLDYTEGMVSSITKNEKEDYILKWWFPFHLRYQLPDKTQNSTKDMTTFWLKNPDISYFCKDDPRVKVNAPLDFEEIVNSDISGDIWRNLYYKQEHLNVSAPVVQNKPDLRVSGISLFNYETFS
eukprot:CAMPEP_0205808302 /NCGR_PEP_ID=MMETSP0205-20121125/12217_1 /ASSEMBLY_ACC=CAM_ASM_000278 /TAXON_ID=36767 /ORGANISM="Euplotes focardii, Strain TN1" /LENGTH=185 /DNA_ID=CAMNT_0053083767 /DNA_START=706 /DNA_END=1260 /DNA_ORIENTATION=-